MFVATHNIITIERESSFFYAFGIMHVVIDDIVSVDLNNGQEQTVRLPVYVNDCNIQILNNVFHIKNVKDIKKIVLKFESNWGPGARRVSCLVTYRDGSELNVNNKSPNIDTNIALHSIVFTLLILFFFFGMYSCTFVGM